VGTKVKINGGVKLAVEVFFEGEKVGIVPLDKLHVYVERLLKEGALQFLQKGAKAPVGFR